MCGSAQTDLRDRRTITAIVDTKPFTLEMAQDFHQRVAAIVAAVQAGIWRPGRMDLVGYSTDFAFGQGRGVQTLILKTSTRSAYARLSWDTIRSDTPADRQLVADCINSAINELR